jgi:hypothetical protein
MVQSKKPRRKYLYYESSEVKTLIDGLSERDFSRLYRMAEQTTFISGLDKHEARDIAHEAIKRVLDGTRRVPKFEVLEDGSFREMQPVMSIGQIISSIARGIYIVRTRHPMVSGNAEEEAIEDVWDSPDAVVLTQTRHRMTPEHVHALDDFHKKVVQHFEEKRDPICVALAQARFTGLSSQEVIERFKLTKNQFESKDKTVRNLILKFLQ